MNNPSFDLRNRVAIVTGASKGIGEAIAQAYAQAGAKVIVSSRKAEAVEAVAERYRKEGWEAQGIACNTGIEEEVIHLVKKTLEIYGQIDIIVNNAGTNIQTGPIIDADMKAFDKMMEVNLKGPLWLSKYAYPSLKKANQGVIIHISSIEGISPSEGLGVYSLTKSALIMMTKVMAQEMGKDNIRVNAICPGYVSTKLTQSIMDNPEEKQRIMDKQTISHEAKPEDIAGIALLLATKAGTFFSGSIIRADGGFTV